MQFTHGSHDTLTVDPAHETERLRGSWGSRRARRTNIWRPGAILSERPNPDPLIYNGYREDECSRASDDENDFAPENLGLECGSLLGRPRFYFYSVFFSQPQVRCGAVVCTKKKSVCTFSRLLHSLHPTAPDRASDRIVRLQ